MGAIAYPDLVASWWGAHPDGPCGWDPPAEHEVEAWHGEVDAHAQELARRWTEPARAGASGDVLVERMAIDLRELLPLPKGDAQHWLEVRVVDEADAPIPKLPITLIRPDGARERASTDDDGVARWRKLPGGRARVVFDDDDAFFAEVG